MKIIVLGRKDIKNVLKLSDVIECVSGVYRMKSSPFIKKEWVKPGTHFSCIGADMKGKEEIDPLLFKGARIFADDVLYL